MARSGINKVILLGNLGADPELRTTAGGDAVATISIATSDSWKDKNTGEDRYKPVVRVDRLNLLSSRKESENNQYSNNNNSTEIPF